MPGQEFRLFYARGEFKVFAPQGTAQLSGDKNDISGLRALP